MQTAIAVPNSPEKVQVRVQQGKIPLRRVLTALFSRILFFAAWQMVLALVFLIAGDPRPWESSIAWWPLSAVLSNLSSLALLSTDMRREGLRLVDLYRVGKITIWRELLITIAVLIPLGPLAFFPGPLLTQWLYNDPLGTATLMFRPLPFALVVVTMILFPITIALAELPTYFGYVMPRLGLITRKPALSWLTAGLMLSLQHMTLPLIFEWRFILYRALMFIFFALGTGFILWKRPRLMPFFMVIHGLMDLSLFFYLLPIAIR